MVTWAALNLGSESESAGTSILLTIFKTEDDEMKVKVFNNDISYLEEEINKWLNETDIVNVVDVTQSRSAYKTEVIVWYEG